MARQIDTLTGVRGIAAIWVALHHGNGYFPIQAVLGPAVSNLLSSGWLGVDLFFVLSGFVISYVHQSDFQSMNAAGYSRFLKLRLARIYPAHVVATLVLVPLVVSARLFALYDFTEETRATYDLPRFIYSLTLLNGWGFPDSIGWNVPSWTVGSEWFAYLLFPLAAWTLSRLRSPWVHVAIIISIFGLMIGLSVSLTGMKTFMLGQSLTLTRIGSEFLIGCSLQNIYRHLLQRSYFDGLALAAALAVIFLGVAALPSFYDFLMITAFAVLILSLSRSRGLAAVSFGSRPLLYLGKVSYSIYLAHVTVLMVVNQALRWMLPADLGEGSRLLISWIVFVSGFLAAGHLLYTFVEEPARLYLRRKWVQEREVV